MTFFISPFAHHKLHGYEITQSDPRLLVDKKLDFSPHTVTGYEVIFKRLIKFLNDA
jgi:hypothetical protein